MNSCGKKLIQISYPLYKVLKEHHTLHATNTTAVNLLLHTNVPHCSSTNV